MKTLLSNFESHAFRDGAKPFVHFIERSIEKTYSYSDVRDRALIAASTIKSAGEAGGVVFIVLRHSIDIYTSFIGAMYAGLTPSILPFPTPKQDRDLYWSSHRDLFARVKPTAIITYEDNIAAIVDALGGAGTKVLNFEDLLLGGSLESYELPGPSDIALLQHSSGTTGQKKGVMLSYGEIANQVDSYSNAIEYGPDDVVVSWLPLYHDMGLLSSFLIPMSLGATIVSMDAFEWVGRPDMLLSHIEKFRGTLSWMPNFAFNHIARLRPPGRTYDLTSMRAFIACSEPCKPETFDFFAETFADCGVSPSSIHACYAMAETVFAVSQSTLGRPVRVHTVIGDALDTDGALHEVDAGARGGRAFVSNGAPIAGLEVVIDAQDGRLPWSPDATSLYSGEILVRGDCVFSGYFRNPEATSLALVDGWYSTGDIGFFSRGELYICGRSKELMIVHGKNYYATDVEEAVNFVDGVKPGRAVAFSLFSERTQSEEGYVVVESELPQESWRDLKRKVKEMVFDRLELTLQTVHVVTPGWLIKTTSGKISRKENSNKYTQSVSSH